MRGSHFRNRRVSLRGLQHTIQGRRRDAPRSKPRGPHCPTIALPLREPIAPCSSLRNSLCVEGIRFARRVLCVAVSRANGRRSLMP